MDVKKTPPSILIIGLFKFPSGSASAERIRAYALAFARHGYEVSVATLHPGGQGSGGWTPLTKEIRYRNLCASPSRVLGILGRPFSRFLAGPEIRKVIQEYQRADPGGLVFIYDRRFSTLFPVLNELDRLKMGRRVVEAVEWFDRSQFRFAPMNLYAWDQWLGRRYCGRRRERMLCISSFIEARYRRIGAPVLRIPALADPAVNPRVSRRESGASIKCIYLGNFKTEDGYQLATQAVKELRMEGLSIEIDLVGKYEGQPLAVRLSAEVKTDSVLSDAIRFSGFVSATRKRELFQDADVIVFPRLATHNARAAFPTRLVEFLLSGLPVITSGVGDVPLYLRDKRDALLVPAGDIGALKNLLREVATGEGGVDLRRVGLEGRASALKHFVPDPYIDDIVQFAIEGEKMNPEITPCRSES